MQNSYICLKINNFYINTQGIKENNTLKFKDNNTEYKYNLKDNILIKTDDETKLILDFNKNIMKYELKKENFNFTKKLQKNLLINKTRQVIINYRVDEEVFNLEINYN